MLPHTSILHLQCKCVCVIDVQIRVVSEVYGVLHSAPIMR
jgi:hypothetical protein